jgi:hypothetical protein
MMPRMSLSFMMSRSSPSMRPRCPTICRTGRGRRSSPWCR